MRLARSENRAFSSRFGPRFPHPLHAVFALTGLGNERRRRNRVIPLQSTRFCSCVLPFFLFLSFPLSVSASSLSFDSEMKMVERQREACETNEQQPLRGSCYPRSIGAYSTGVPLPTRYTYPMYVCIFSPVFRLCFSPYDERNATNDLLPVFLVQREEKRIFICTHGRAP